MRDRTELLDTLRKSAAALPDVEERKMFGCEALFTKGAIFALLWKTGRIGVKLPDGARYDALASQKGAEPWKAGPVRMAHWLLVPAALDADAKKLAPWVKEAHAMASAGIGSISTKAADSAASKIRKRTQRTRDKENRMAAKKNTKAAGDSIATEPSGAMEVAEEVVRTVTKVAKAAAGAAKAVVKKATTKGKKKAGGAKKKAAKVVEKTKAAAKKATAEVKKKAGSAKKKAAGAVKKAKATAKKK